MSGQRDAGNVGKRCGRPAACGPGARAALLLGLVTLAGAALAQSDAELAVEIANPIANIVSIPLQSNWERKVGPVDGGRRYVLNVQPVIPFKINNEWNLITRTIVPVVDQSEIFPGAGSQFGLSDTLFSGWFSPAKPTAGGWIWGVGATFLIPTGTDDYLTTGKWGLGPTAVAVKQDGGLTYGALANHVWSVAGQSSRADISSTFVQPFVTYVWPNAWGVAALAEVTRDWENSQTSAPITALVTKMTRIGNVPVQFLVGPRYYASSFDNGAKGWGARFNVVVLLPK